MSDYICELHQIKFKSFYSYKDHMFKQHEIVVKKSNLKSNLKCNLCEDKFYFNHQRIDHLKDKHQINLEEIVLKFNKLEDFYEWKITEEFKTNSSFTISSKATNIIYNCNRNPKTVDKNRLLERKRDLKSSGYRHIDENLCPAQMLIKQIQDGGYQLNYINNHMGHDLNKAHLNIPNNIKEKVVNLLENKIDKDYIIKNSKRIFDLKLSKRDVDNIIKKFKINISK